MDYTDLNLLTSFPTFLSYPKLSENLLFTEVMEAEELTAYLLLLLWFFKSNLSVSCQNLQQNTSSSLPSVPVDPIDLPNNTLILIALSQTPTPAYNTLSGNAQTSPSEQ